MAGVSYVFVCHLYINMFVALFCVLLSVSFVVCLSVSIWLYRKPCISFGCFFQPTLYWTCQTLFIYAIHRFTKYINLSICNLAVPSTSLHINVCESCEQWKLYTDNGATTSSEIIMKERCINWKKRGNNNSIETAPCHTHTHKRRALEIKFAQKNAHT